MNRVLLIAFHFPPMVGSSGVHRPLKFAEYLPEYGWQPTVLTAHPRVHPNVSDDQLQDIPAHCGVTRTTALDTARHLALFGRYPRVLASPDRWMSWWFSAIPVGLALIRRFKPDVLWSTYPISTSHWIGKTLSKLSGIPWVADFRDPMTEPGFPQDPVIWKRRRRLEGQVVKQSSKVVFTAPGMRRMYAERYADISDDHWCVIENGYDESVFSSATVDPNCGVDGRIKLVHSGILYPSERDPTQFFKALQTLVQSGTLDSTRVKIVLRATGHDDVIGGMLKEYGLTQIVSTEPPVPHKDAIEEMLNSDGLLILQAENCNDQIPAKLYEYIRAGKPVFALTDPKGDTADALRRAGYGDIADIRNADEIGLKFEDFLAAVSVDEAYVADYDTVAGFSRRSQAGQLGAVFDTVLTEQNRTGGS